MNKSKNNQVRQTDRLYLDFVKGAAVFLMIWGHCIQYCATEEFDFFENSIFKFIYSFHMPLFMMISGYLFAFSCKKRELSNLLVHRTQGLLQPIIMCTIFNYILTNVIAKRHFLNLFDAHWFSELGTLWFLWSVLSASIIVGIAFKTTSRQILRVFIIVLGFIFVSLFPNAEMNIFMYPYFVIGFVFMFMKDKIPQWINNTKYLALIVFPIMLFFFSKKHYIYTTGIFNLEYDVLSVISINTFRWIIGLVGGIFALVILQWLVIIAKRIRILSYIINATASLGKKSLQVYCLSVSLLSFFLPKIYNFVCMKTGFNIFAQNMIVYNMFFTPVIAIIYCIGLYYLVRTLEKIIIGKVIFGR